MQMDLPNVTENYLKPQNTKKCNITPFFCTFIFLNIHTLGNIYDFHTYDWGTLKHFC